MAGSMHVGACLLAVRVLSWDHAFGAHTHTHTHTHTWPTRITHTAVHTCTSASAKFTCVACDVLDLLMCGSQAFLLVHTCTYAHAHMHMHVCAYAHMHICTCTCTHSFRTHAHARGYAPTHAARTQMHI